MSGLSELEDGFEALQRKYEKYLPKVDSKLVGDLLRRSIGRPDLVPIYVVEDLRSPG